MKVEEIARTLIARLESGVYGTGSRFPSEYRLAEEFSVDKTTANKAVAQLVGKGYLERGKQGSGTYVKQTRLFPAGHIAIILPSPIDYFNARILDGAQNAALARGYLMNVIAPPSGELERYLNSLGKSTVAGVISVGMSVQVPVPSITVDYDYAAELPGGNLVNTDNLAGGHAMMREVIARGHREIAVYSTIRINLDRQRRVRGFVAEMEKMKNRRIGERIYYGAQWSAADAEKNLAQMLRDFPELSIIVCDSDDAASVLLDAAKKLKIDLPGRIAVTGFGNVIGNYGGILNIANVEQFPDRLGAAACSHLIRRIESGKEAEPVRDFFPPELIHPEYIPSVDVK